MDVAKIKNYIANFIYQMIQKWYIKLANKKHGNLLQLKDDYTYIINPKFRRCNVALFNPIECVYFALAQVYERLAIIRIQGVTLTYDNDIQVNIYTHRPGLIIGFKGRDIDKLTSILTSMFNKTVRINLVEIKQDFFIRNY